MESSENPYIFFPFDLREGGIPQVATAQTTSAAVSAITLTHTRAHAHACKTLEEKKTDLGEVSRIQKNREDLREKVFLQTEATFPKQTQSK